MNAKHLQFICILLLPSIPLLITLKCTLNIFATAVTIQCKGLSVPGQEECTTDVHLTPFVWAVHTNEGWKVYTINILLRNIMYCRCVSTSMSVQRVMQESSQLAEVINQASHLTSSIVHLLKIAPSSSLLT